LLSYTQVDAASSRFAIVWTSSTERRFMRVDYPDFTRRIYRILKRHFEDMAGEHLRRAAADIEQEMRHVSARLTGELTKFEGAEIIPGGR
jgi:hypothetical protein